MSPIKAVVTDYIGTLINARCYTMEDSISKLHLALSDSGYKTDKQEFLEAYSKAHEKYRLIRYGEFREVTNAVWVSETLRSLGYEACAEDPMMKAALNVFFQDYVESLELRPYAKKFLKKASEGFKLGLVSNFTYGPVVHSSIRRLGIGDYFNSITVSGDCGWRKPHGKIFHETLTRLNVKPEETVYIGDSPVEDIRGAKQVGMKTVFVCSQFYSLNDLKASAETPDVVVKNLEEIYHNFEGIIS